MVGRSVRVLADDDERPARSSDGHGFDEAMGEGSDHAFAGAPGAIGKDPGAGEIGSRQVELQHCSSP